MTLRPDDKAEYDAAARARLIPLVEMAGLAIRAWNKLNKSQQDALIEERHQAAASVPAATS